jgi:hypothetical protein
MQSLSLQKAKPPELRKQSLCQCPEGKAYALKAKPMPAEGKPPELHVMNHPVTSRFIPFQRFTVSAFHPFHLFHPFQRFTVSNPYILETKRNDQGKADTCTGEAPQAKPSEKR